MAFRSNGPITLALPPFRGVTRRIILTAVVVYFGSLVLALYSADLAANLLNFFVLHPFLALHKLVWEVVTYPFVSGGLINLLLSLLMVWFFGSALEDELGPLWLSEYFFISTIGGGVLASLLSIATGDHVPGLGSHDVLTAGMGVAVLALVTAFAKLHPELEMRLFFLITVKAKYVAVIYLLIYLAVTLGGGDRFGALTALCNAGSGYVFLQVAPRRGFRVGIAERWYGLRNAYIRSKRRRAAKKFTVYMKKQGKEVSLDDQGRYVDPDGKVRDLKDKRWMN